MNMVGNQGKGESVWLGFFLFEVLNQFIVLAQARNDIEFVELCNKAAKKYRRILKKTDGTENGTGVHISIMGYRLDQQVTMNARLIPLHKAGQCSQEPAAMTGPGLLWNQ